MFLKSCARRTRGRSVGALKDIVDVADAGGDYARCGSPLPSCHNESHFDALVIAGGGQTEAGPPTHVVLRLEKALEL